MSQHPVHVIIIIYASVTYSRGLGVIAHEITRFSVNVAPVNLCLIIIHDIWEWTCITVYRHVQIVGSVCGCPPQRMTHSSTGPCCAVSMSLAGTESVVLLSGRPVTVQRSSIIRLGGRGMGRSVCDSRGAVLGVPVRGSGMCYWEVWGKWQQCSPQE